MQLTTYRPRKLLSPFNTNFGLFDDFFAPFTGVVKNQSPSSFIPSVDIYEKDDKLCLEAELPGFEKEEIKVDIKGKLLTLSGERTSTEEVNEENRFRQERRYGKFERTFRLPFDTSEDQIQATYKNGILKLIVDKPAEQKPRQITIN